MEVAMQYQKPLSPQPHTIATEWITELISLLFFSCIVSLILEIVVKKHNSLNTHTYTQSH